MSPQYVILLAWLIWAISWFVAALWNVATVQKLGPWRQAAYRLPGALGIILLFGLYPHAIATDLHLWHAEGALSWTLIAIALAGFALTWWARLHLGYLWSVSITRKDNHHVVDTGPYRFVRHPIYSGLILAAF